MIYLKLDFNLFETCLLIQNFLIVHQIMHRDKTNTFELCHFVDMFCTKQIEVDLYSYLFLCLVHIQKNNP